MRSFAQDTATSSDTAAQMGAISVVGRTGGVDLEIALDHLSRQPRVSRLSDPDRIAFDFTGVMPAAGYRKQTVGSFSVKSVRTALFASDSQGRPVTRVVVDLNQPASYTTRSEKGRFIISIRDEPAASTATQAKSNPPAPKSTPAAKPVPATSEPTSAAYNRLTDLQFGDTSVTLIFNDAVHPRTMFLQDPERLVLDIPGVVAVSPENKKVTGPLSERVSGIRTAQFRDDPALFRVVLDQVEEGLRPKLDVDANRVTVQYAPGVARSAKPVTARSAAPPRPTSARSSAPTPLATPPVPKSRTKSPLSKHGPRVTYVNGLLSIDATNANIADVLYEVGEQTGAVIDMPFSEGMLDQVTFTMGPSKPRDVLSTFLEGSGFNYYIVENGSGELEKIILIPKQADTANVP